MKEEIWKKLTDPSTYIETLAILTAKYHSEKRVLHSSPVIPDLNLKNMILNSVEVSEFLASKMLSEDFEFSPQKLIEIKNENKVRKIYVSPWPDKIMLMTIGRLLSLELNSKLHAQLYSFRKGSGPLNAQEALSNFLTKTTDCYILKRDITKYGDTINQYKLLQMLKADGIDPRLIKILGKAISPNIISNANPTPTKMESGIPSGSPLVPVIENYYLLELDRRLMQFKDCFFARYGDDFIFATSNKEQARIADEVINQYVTKLDLKISPNKVENIFLTTKSHALQEGYDCAEYFDWLGVSIHADGEISFKKKHLDNFKGFFESEISCLFSRSQSWSLPLPEKLLAMENSLNALLNFRTNPKISKLIVYKTEQDLVKELDHYIKVLVVRLMHRKWSLTKSQAWKALRNMSITSLNYQRRQFLGRRTK